MEKMIRIGTSGFSYKDWVGPVYPAGLPERDWLSFYAREFSTVELNVTCVDEPRLKGLMPPVAVATGPVAYLRFHGRNAPRWYEHEEAWQRYDYTYSDSELREWVPKLHQLDEAAPLTLVYFNNHFRGQASIGARDLGRLLAQEKLL